MDRNGRTKVNCVEMHPSYTKPILGAKCDPSAASLEQPWRIPTGVRLALDFPEAHSDPEPFRMCIF